MESVVPWRELEAVIEPYYPKPGNGSQSVGFSIMLRVYFLQQWFNLSDPGGEDALYESPVLRRFAGVDLGRAPASDETTILCFRRLHGEERKVCHPTDEDLSVGTSAWGDGGYQGQGRTLRISGLCRASFKGQKLFFL